MTQSVSITSMAAMCVTFLVAVGLPLGVMAVYAWKHKKQGVIFAWLLGAAGFFVTQVAIRLPILSFLGTLPAFVRFAEEHYLVYALILAFTAGLFEVVGRVAAAKMLSKDLNFTKGFAEGLGHGGIEAMVLIGLSYVSNLAMAVMINTGSIQEVIAQTAALGVDTAPLTQAIDTLVGTSPALFLLAGFERILTMISHLAMSLIVCYFMAKKQTLKGVGICLAIHTLLDGVSAVVSGLATPYLGSVMSQSASYVVIYIFLTAIAVVSVIIIRKIKGTWPLEENEKKDCTSFAGEALYGANIERDSGNSGRE